MEGKRDTVGYGNAKEKPDVSGVQITIRFSAKIYSSLNKARKVLGLEDFRSVFMRAIAEYSNALGLISKGYSVYAGDSLHKDSINLDLGIKEPTIIEDENVEVVAEMQPRFTLEELRALAAIQKIFEKETEYPISVDEIISESITVLIWMVTKRLQGKRVYAAKNKQGAHSCLPIDKETLLIKRK